MLCYCRCVTHSVCVHLLKKHLIQVLWVSIDRPLRLSTSCSLLKTNTTPGQTWIYCDSHWWSQWWALTGFIPRLVSGATKERCIFYRDQIQDECEGAEWTNPSQQEQLCEGQEEESELLRWTVSSQLQSGEITFVLIVRTAVQTAAHDVGKMNKLDNLAQF